MFDLKQSIYGRSYEHKTQLKKHYEKSTKIRTQDTTKTLTRKHW
jgi:hypothetical protein